MTFFFEEIFLRVTIFLVQLFPLFNHRLKLNSDKFDSVDSHTQLILQVLDNYAPYIFMCFGEGDMPQ